MADLNALIAQGAQFRPPSDPFAQYAQMQQIQSAQQQGQLNALKMQEYQRESATNNALSQAYQAAYNPDTGTYDINKLRGAVIGAGAGSRLPGIEKQMGELRTQQFAQGKAETELADAKLKQARSFLDTINPADPNAPQQYIAWHESNHRDPVLGPLLASRGVTADQARGRIMQAIQQGPQAFAQLLMQSKLGTEKFIELNKPSTQVIDQSGQRQVVQIPGLGGTPTTVGTYADVPLPPNVEAQKVRVAQAGRSPGTTVVLPAQEKAFEAELGKEQAGKLVKDKIVAEDARSIISTIEEGRRLLKSGVITGFGASFLTEVGAALNQAGVNFAEEPVANTQAFTANMAANVGRIIKQFGAGTGLSNADREYAEKMAGGKVTLDRKSIERILDINERMARNVISLHNRNAAKVKTNVPLTVEEPSRAGAQADGASVTLPDGRVMSFPSAAAAAAFKKSAGL